MTTGAFTGKRPLFLFAQPLPLCGTSAFSVAKVHHRRGLDSLEIGVLPAIDTESQFASAGGANPHAFIALAGTIIRTGGNAASPKTGTIMPFD
jgi:hypothetical protein